MKAIRIAIVASVPALAFAGEAAPKAKRRQADENAGKAVPPAPYTGDKAH